MLYSITYRGLCVLSVSLTVAVTTMSMSSTRFFLKQSINVPALKQLSSIIWNPSLAVPTIELNSISELNLDQLKRNGVKCIIFDKDNTLR